MTVSIVQSASSEISVLSPEHTSHSLAWPSAPAAGNTLIAILTRYDDVIGGTGTINDPSGWTQRADEQTDINAARTMRIVTKVADASEPSVAFTFDSTRRTILEIIEVPVPFAGIASGTGTSASSQSLSTASPTGGLDGLILQVIVAGNAQGINTYPSGWTVVDEIVADDGASERLNLFSKSVDPTSGTYSGTVVYAGSVITCKAALWFVSTAPVADFTADLTSIGVGDSINFEDLSSGAPTSWAWTFGDGGTSTSQDPSHVYASPGTYTVSLTATNAFGADTETKTSYIVVLADSSFEDPPPAAVLLEIYAASPGSARWDEAIWDVDAWSGAGWQNVTPYGITVEILWGSDRPELGILNVPRPASWGIDYYDPDRILDPANVDGPYYGDLQPGLPVRLSHRGIVVRQGYATGISHSYENPNTGQMRCADAITVLANAQVPSDTELADTLYARTIDAIAAAGLAVQVGPVPAVDPPVSPWITGTREWSAWEWIRDAAQEVLYIPYVDRRNILTFRPWASPLVRGRTITDAELVDVNVVADYSGQYSVIRAREDETTIVERALTPPPRYGARTYTRDEITIDPGPWAEAVLADRGLPSLRWEPGTIYPLTADSVENIATIEATERISIHLPDEGLFVTGIVTGGEITVRGRLPDEAVWRFRLHVAQVADEPLIESGGGPTDYLLSSAGDEFLYPST